MSVHKAFVIDFNSGLGSLEFLCEASSGFEMLWEYYCKEYMPNRDPELTTLSLVIYENSDLGFNKAMEITDNFRAEFEFEFRDANYKLSAYALNDMIDAYVTKNLSVAEWMNNHYHDFEETFE